MSKTKIEWTDYSWNPVVGCTKVSDGCANCYAERSARLHYNKDFPNGWDGHVKLFLERTHQPLSWSAPLRIFVGSMGDFFHPKITNEFRDKILATIAICHQHTFIILTKRPDEMLSYLTMKVGTPWINRVARDISLLIQDAMSFTSRHDRWAEIKHLAKQLMMGNYWPLPNVWHGVSISSEKDLWMVEELLKTPAAIRFVSFEPMLGPVDLGLSVGRKHGAEYHNKYGPCTCDRDKRIDWVIVGGESGPGARPMYPGWPRSIRDQCQDAGVPFFFKQHGEWVGYDDLESYELSEKQKIKIHSWPDGRCSYRVGKKRAGRMLDGREWNEVPDKRV